jgi:hypothetical protein
VADLQIDVDAQLLVRDGAIERDLDVADFLDVPVRDAVVAVREAVEDLQSVVGTEATLLLIQTALAGVLNVRVAPVDQGNDAAIPVGNASTDVLDANPDRRELSVINDSDAVIYLVRGPVAALNQGVRLNPHGGSYTSNVYTGSLTAIHGGAGSKNLLVVES